MSGIDSMSNVGESPSGTEEFSVDRGKDALNINVSAKAKSNAQGGGETNAENSSDKQVTKDMEGADSDYTGAIPGGHDPNSIDDIGSGQESEKPVDSEIDEIKEGVADGLMAIEELQPGFIKDLMDEIEDDSGQTNQQVADKIGTDQNQVNDRGEVVKPQGDAESGENSGGNEDLLAGLEELATILEQIISAIEGCETEGPGGGENDLPDTAEPISDPVETFMEIFEQLSPEAQDEVVEILASGVFGAKGIEAAENMDEDTDGEIDSAKVADAVEG
jgi:hypothetical protein